MDDKMPRDYNASEAKWTLYVAMAVDEYREGAVTNAFFPVSEE